MEKLIACCGLDCTTCDAYKATILDDNELRAKTAAIWREQFSPDITDEMINCTGCRQEGAKFAHCFQCEIRKPAPNAINWRPATLWEVSTNTCRKRSRILNL
jgi:Protein of unknown function (DUF3795)